MNIAVLGSGNGGCAVAFDYGKLGHAVRLFDFENFPDNIKTIQQQGGIHAEGELEGFAPIAYAGHEIEVALRNADIIYAVGPAYSTRAFAKACRPYLRTGQIVIICPGSCMGSLEFKNQAQLSLKDETIIVAETSTLPYAVRLIEPGKLQVYLKLNAGLFVAALPGRITPKVLEKIRDIYPAMTAAKNILQTSLQNGNPVIHPAISLLNAALIERTQGKFYFYEEGVTPAVGRLIKAIDQERIALGQAFEIEVIPEPDLGYIQGYMAEPTYDKGYSEAPGFQGIKAQSSLEYRYFHEDVGYGLVFLQSLAEQLGVETPSISAVIRIVSVLMEQDYITQGKRTMKSLGLSGHSLEELQLLLT
jgi:opine dehydrogenase